MQYPVALLPRFFYKVISVNDLISAVSNQYNHDVFLLREINNSEHKPLFRARTGNPDIDIITDLILPHGSSHIFTFSVSLFGEYRKEHLKVSLEFHKHETELKENYKNKINKDFIPGRHRSTSIHSIPSTLVKSSNKDGLLFSLNRSHNRIIEIPKATFGELTTEPSYFRFKSIVNHKPTVVNYWHFQIDYAEENQSLVEKVKSGKGSKKNVRNHIIKNIIKSSNVKVADSQFNVKVPHKLYKEKLRKRFSLMIKLYLLRKFEKTL